MIPIFVLKSARTAALIPSNPRASIVCQRQRLPEWLLRFRYPFWFRFWWWHWQ